MTQHASPSLEQYPGYFPAAKPPFWTRTKVGIVAALFGVLFGMASNGADSAAETPEAKAPSAASVSAADVQQKVDDAVDQAQADMQDKVDAARAQADDRAARIIKRSEFAQRRAVARAVAKTRATVQARAARTIAQLRTQAASPASAPAAAASVPTATGGRLDPRFSYCYEANDAGYGTYVRGQDPEYDWYDDADNDGVVCEF
jgi:hypothetical protein